MADKDDEQPKGGSSVLNGGDYEAWMKARQEGRGTMAERPPEGGGGDDGEHDGDGGRKQPDGDGDGRQDNPPDDPNDTSGDGDGKPGNEPGEGTEDGKLPPQFAKRLAREQRKHNRETKALQDEIAELRARIDGNREPPPDAGGGDGKPPKQGGKDAGQDEQAKAPKDMEPKDQYEALGLDRFGPNIADYDDLEEGDAKWAEDYEAFIANKPLKNHPGLDKVPEGGDGGKGGGADADANRQPEGGGKRQPSDEDRERARQHRQLQAKMDMDFEIIKETFVDEAEPGEDETKEDIEDFFEEFEAMVTQGRLPLSPAMLEHIANSDDCVEIVREFKNHPVKAKRIFANLRKPHGEEIDAMLKRARERESQAKGGGNDLPPKDNRRRLGEPSPLPRGGGGSHKPGTDGYRSDMSQAEYEERRAEEMKQAGTGFFYRG